jgi:hypothetical protein
VRLFLHIKRPKNSLGNEETDCHVNVKSENQLNLHHLEKEKKQKDKDNLHVFHTIYDKDLIVLHFGGCKQWWDHA